MRRLVWHACRVFRNLSFGINCRPLWDGINVIFGLFIHFELRLEFVIGAVTDQIQLLLSFVNTPESNVEDDTAHSC